MAVPILPPAVKRAPPPPARLTFPLPQAAALAGAAGVAAYLLSRGASCDARGGMGASSLHLAVSGAVCVWGKHRVRVCLTRLWQAMSGSPEAVRVLAAAGGALDAVDDLGRMPVRGRPGWLRGGCG